MGIFPAGPPNRGGLYDLGKQASGDDAEGEEG